VTALAEIAPATRPYEPFGAARDLFYCTDREVLIDGPAGTGKTRAIVEKCHLLCQEVPNIRVLWLRATRRSMTETVLVTFETKVVPEGSYLTQGARRSYRQDYHYANGTEIVLGGLDNVDRIMSSEYDVICVFEATEITLNDWEMLLTRLRNNAMGYHQQIADCNPSHPRHWLIQRAKSGKMSRLPSRFEDNPSITPVYLTGLAGLSGHRRARLYEGLWSAAEGLVYPDAEMCFVEHSEPVPGRLVGGIDFGYTNPFCALGGTAYKGDDDRTHLYIWYERYISQALVGSHATALPPGHVWWADPSEPDSIVELGRAGHRVGKAKNDILIGVNAVLSRMDAGTLHISERCRALRAELEAYHYDPDKLSEKPVDEFNHACDALRYLVMGVDRGRVAR